MEMSNLANIAYKQDWENLKAAGNEHYKNSRWTEAISCYTDAIDINAKEAVLYSNRALCEIKLNKFDLAREDAKKAIEIDATQVKFYRTLSEALSNLRLYEEAVEVCQNGLRINPGDETLIARLCDCQAFIADREIKKHPVCGNKDELKLPGVLNNVAAQLKKSISDASPGDIGIVDAIQIETTAEIKRAHQLLMAGRGTTRGERKAFKIFESAASRGSAEGLYNLALMYLDGMAGLARNPQKYLDLCLQAAKQKPYLKIEATGVVVRNIGVSEAETGIGIAYRDGLAVNQDYRLAFQWFSKAAEHGCPSGMNNLGMALFNGLGCRVDPKSARFWYQKSAELGQTEAQYNLAEMLAKGQGGDRDTVKAAELLKAAANRGLPGARQALQQLQRTGTFGVGASPGMGMPLFDSLVADVSKKLQDMLKDSANFNENRCSHCEKLKALLHCSKCKTAYYCDRDCQLKHWKKHKKLCSA